MTELLRSAEMRAVEEVEIARGAVSGLALMEAAGHASVNAILAEWPRFSGPRLPSEHSDDAEGGDEYLEREEGAWRATVLCGPGNNGGDGFVVARLLAVRGWEVSVYLLGDASKLPPDARANYTRWLEIGDVVPLPAACSAPWRADLVVDAVFGIGLTRAVNDDVMVSIFSFMPPEDVIGPDRRPQVVALDIPTGLSADTGRLMPVAVEADMTVTFHARKLGHVLGRGPAVCGVLRVVDIGLSPGPLGKYVRLGSAPEPWLAKGGGQHKFAHGHAFILCGGAGRTGAARLAARGALRIGAGLVTLGVPPSAQLEVASQITSIMLTRVGDGGGLAAVLEDGRLNALCLGPGLGLDRARDCVPVALGAQQDKTGPRRAVILDADALTAYEPEPQRLFEMLHARCVITPHGGEFARLFPDIAARLSEADKTGGDYSKVDATRDAAARAGCVVLFKGPDTVIAAPDGKCAVHAASAPWLATAGSGDVLAGFITGLWARGFDPMTAAETGVWAHSACARRFGPGLIAEDLPEQLPGVFQDLGL